MSSEPPTAARLKEIKDAHRRLSVDHLLVLSLCHQGYKLSEITQLLNITYLKLTDRLKEISDAFGYHVFIRGQSGVSLSEDGKVLAVKALFACDALGIERTAPYFARQLQKKPKPLKAKIKRETTKKPRNNSCGFLGPGV